MSEYTVYDRNKTFRHHHSFDAVCVRCKKNFVSHFAGTKHCSGKCREKSHDPGHGKGKRHKRPMLVIKRYRKCRICSKRWRVTHDKRHNKTCGESCGIILGSVSATRRFKSRKLRLAKGKVKRADAKSKRFTSAGIGMMNLVKFD